MPHQDLSPELIFAASIWLTAIFIFVIMLITAFASLRSTDKTEAKSRSGTELKFNSIIARFQLKRKPKNRP
jgi:hypothetical protein